MVGRRSKKPVRRRGGKKKKKKHAERGRRPPAHDAVNEAGHPGFPGPPRRGGRSPPGCDDHGSRRRPSPRTRSIEQAPPQSRSPPPRPVGRLAPAMIRVTHAVPRPQSPAPPSANRSASAQPRYRSRRRSDSASRRGGPLDPIAFPRGRPARRFAGDVLAMHACPLRLDAAARAGAPGVHSRSDCRGLAPTQTERGRGRAQASAGKTGPPGQATARGAPVPPMPPGGVRRGLSAQPARAACSTCSPSIPAHSRRKLVAENPEPAISRPRGATNPHVRRSGGLDAARFPVTAEPSPPLVCGGPFGDYDPALVWLGFRILQPRRLSIRPFDRVHSMTRGPRAPRAAGGSAAREAGVPALTPPRFQREPGSASPAAPLRSALSRETASPPGNRSVGTRRGGRCAR